VESYTVGDKASLENIDNCKIEGYEHNFNFGKLKPSGYSSTIFQADVYDCKVSFLNTLFFSFFRLTNDSPPLLFRLAG